MPAKNIYVTKEALAHQLGLSQSKGEPTAEVCQMFRDIAVNMLKGPRYRRYPENLKEDLASAALLKCVRNIRNYRPEYASGCFSYFTRCCEHAFWECLERHYRQMNIRRKLTRDYADSIRQMNPAEAKRLMDGLLDEDTTHILDR